MLLKIVGILIVTFALAVAGYGSWAIPFFIIALGIAFIVESVRVPVNNPEFAPYVQRIKDAKPEAVLVTLQMSRRWVTSRCRRAYSTR